MTALLIGYTTEKTFRHTVEHGRAAGLAADVLDLALLREAAGQLRIVETADGLAVSLAGRTFEFGAYDAFYNRAYWTELGSPIRSAALGGLVRAVLAWLAHCDGVVVNRTGAGASNANKFVHGLQLQRLGFATPPTFLSGDPIEAGRLGQQGGELVSKSCSSTKTRTVAADAAVWDRLDRIAVCPTLFQTRIWGDEVRAHWVGGEIYAERVRTHRVDYRFPDAGVPANSHSPCEVPRAIARLCDRYCRSQGLTFAGFDFKVTEAGDWVALECNPMPGYESYDRRLGGRIAAALVRLLASGRPTPPVADRQAAYASPSGWGISAAAPVAAPYRADVYEAPPATDADEPPDELFVASVRRPLTAPFYYERPLA